MVGKARPDLFDAHDLPHLIDGGILADDVAVRQLELRVQGWDPVRDAPRLETQTIRKTIEIVAFTERMSRIRSLWENLA